MMYNIATFDYIGQKAHVSKRENSLIYSNTNHHKQTDQMHTLINASDDSHNKYLTLI